MTMLGLLFVFAMNVTIPLFLQAGHGMTPLGASLALAPGILLTVVMGPVAGRVFDRRGGRVLIPLGFLVMAVFVTLVGIAAGQTSVLLFGLAYIPAVLATAFVIGPSQTFALSHLDREAAPHGVTVVSTSFQIAGCVGTSLAAGIYGALTAAGMEAGRGEFDSLLTGFRAAVALVVITSVIGIVLAILAHRAGRAARTESAGARRTDARTTEDATASASAHVGRDADSSVAAIMQTDVYALSPDQTVLQALRFLADRGISGAPVLDADGLPVGFLSDGDVMRYLSAAQPSSTSIWSFAFGEDADLERAMTELADLDVMRLAARDVLTVAEDDSIADAVVVLSDARIKKLPVVRRTDGAVVGIVSRSAVNRLAIARCGDVRADGRQLAGSPAH